MTDGSKSADDLRRSGAWKGSVWISEDFDSPLPEDLLGEFTGETGSPAADPASSDVDIQQPQKRADCISTAD